MEFRIINLEDLGIPRVETEEVLGKLQRLVSQCNNPDERLALARAAYAIGRQNYANDLIDYAESLQMRFFTEFKDRCPNPMLVLDSVAEVDEERLIHRFLRKLLGKATDTQSAIEMAIDSPPAPQLCAFQDHSISAFHGTVHPRDLTHDSKLSYDLHRLLNRFFNSVAE